MNEELFREKIHGVQEEDQLHCTFSHFLQREDLPNFGSGKEYLKEIEFESSNQANVEINESIKDRDNIFMDWIVNESQK